MSRYIKRYARLAKLTDKQLLSSLKILKKEYERNFSRIMVNHDSKNWGEHRKHTFIEKKLNSENVALLNEINGRDMKYMRVEKKGENIWQ